MSIRDLRFRFIGEDASLGSTMEGVSTRTAALGSALGNLAANGVTAGLGALKDFAAGSVDAFARVEDALGVSGVTFGESSQIIESFAAKAAGAFGISEGAALDAANTFGSVGKSAGLSGADLANFSTKFTGLAGDLASFKGARPEDAITAIGAAMRGETEPIRAFGVSIDDAALRAEALKQGLIKTTKEGLTPQQKALAASALIFQQTSDAQGDFQRTSDSTANTQKRLAAETENAQAALGEKLAPAVTAAREVFLKLITGLSSMVDGFKQLEPAVNLAATALSPLVALAGNTAFQAFALAIGTVTVAMNAGAIASAAATLAMTAYVGVMSFAIGAVSAVTGAVTAMNIAMRANPIGAVVTVVLALAAALTFAYKNSETFRRVVDGAFDAVKVAAGNMVGAMVTGFRAILSVWLTVAGGIVSAAATALSWVPGVGPKLQQANEAFDKMKTGILASLGTVADKAFGFGERTGKGVAAGATSTTAAAALAGGTIGNKVVDEVGARQGQARAAGSSLGRAAIGGVRSSADGSYSIGLDVGDGLTRGLRARQDAVVQAARALGAAAIGGVRRAAETFSPSKATIRVGQDIGDGLVIGMRNRHPEVTAAAVAVARGVVDALASKASGLRDAFRGGLSNAFGGVKELFLPGEDGNEHTMDAVIGRLRQQLTTARRFAAELHELGKAGLDPKVLADIAAAGPALGSAIAHNIATAGPAAISEINSLTAQLALTTTTGVDALAADLYGPGANAATAFIAGLQSKDAELQAALEGIRAQVDAVFGSTGRGPSASLAAASISKRSAPITVVSQIDGREVARATVDPLRRELAQTSNRNGGTSPVNR